MPDRQWGTVLTPFECLNKRNKPFECIMCGDSFETPKKLAEHQHYFCTGGW